MMVITVRMGLVAAQNAFCQKIKCVRHWIVGIRYQLYHFHQVQVSVCFAFSHFCCQYTRTINVLGNFSDSLRTVSEYEYDETNCIFSTLSPHFLSLQHKTSKTSIQFEHHPSIQLHLRLEVSVFCTNYSLFVVFFFKSMFLIIFKCFRLFSIKLICKLHFFSETHNLQCWFCIFAIVRYERKQNIQNQSKLSVSGAIKTIFFSYQFMKRTNSIKTIFKFTKLITVQSDSGMVNAVGHRESNF